MAIHSFAKTIAATGVAEPLATLTALLALTPPIPSSRANTVTIYSEASNNVLGIRVGDSHITNTASPPVGLPLAPGDERSFTPGADRNPHDVTTTYVMGTSGDVVNVTFTGS